MLLAYHTIQVNQYHPFKNLIVIFPSHMLVLVAHNGYGFDYKMLASEMKRHAIDSSCFDGIKFSDSLHHLRQVKKNHALAMTITYNYDIIRNNNKDAHHCQA